MKSAAIIIVVIILIVAGLLIWHFAPGLRTRAQDAYDKYGGWTEKARKADPLGFIEYADKKLTSDLAALEQTSANLTQARESMAHHLVKNEALLKAATTQAEKFRAAYKEAEAARSWPVEISAAKYTKAELIEQVRLILSQKKSFGQIIDGLKKTTVAVKAKELKLVTQIAGTKAALNTLPAKKAIARANELTADTQKLLDQVNSLLGENQVILTDKSIRTVEELIAADEKPADASAALDVDVKTFLESN